MQDSEVMRKYADDHRANQKCPLQEPCEEQGFSRHQQSQARLAWTGTWLLHLHLEYHTPSTHSSDVCTLYAVNHPLGDLSGAKLGCIL